MTDKRLIVTTNNTKRPVTIDVKDVSDEDLEHDWNDVIGELLEEQVARGVDDAGEPIDLIDPAKETDWTEYEFV